MDTNEILGEIKEINLGYILLAQRMLREDKVAAMYRLGIGQDVSEIIGNLTSSQILKMAASNTLLCRFRFDDRLIAEMLSSHSRDHAASVSHAAILMAGQPAEAMV
ncbi:MAG: flagellar transcriptional regulator FlhD [Nitrosomonadales bacterium]|jgi:flagellar transcriptional activator FlhD|nr:MAG: flagellar transcriptional regulator FlhD [Nitrosomonadales bacterium]